MFPLTRSARVCALIPHHDCGEWLSGAIASLMGQTRAVDAVVVLDDASTHPPLAAARCHPSVTFLRASENVGPYRLLQTAITRTNFDAYLFQDADDLSHPDRLATLLDVAEAHGAEIVGSHEVQIDVTTPEASTREYPLDVNADLAGDPSDFALLHPASLVSREAVMRAGGFAGGLRFSGDVDFLWRAAHVARIVNADRHLYLRRRHPESLTGSPATGTRSRARRELDGALRGRARQNAARVTAGEAPDLSPFAAAPPVTLGHLAGPALGTLPSRRLPLPATSPGAEPVLIVGGPRNGGDVLAWALDLHPRFEAVPDMDDLDDRCRLGRRRPVLAGPVASATALALADRYPGSCVVSVERDVETAVASLVARPDAHGNFYSEALARSAAVELGCAGHLLRTALGADRVLRIGLARLVEDPAAALDEILSFLGEESFPGAALPLAGLRVATGEDLRPDGIERTPADARRLLERHRRSSLQPLSLRLRALASEHLGDDAAVAVVSRGDASLLDLGVGRAWHFPGTEDGSYAGEYPPTGQAAVALLEDVRRCGATHLLLPAPAGWWLTHYLELRRHLDRRYRLVAAAEGTGALYDLTGRAAPNLTRAGLVHR